MHRGFFAFPLGEYFVNKLWISSKATVGGLSRNVRIALQSCSGHRYNTSYTNYPVFKYKNSLGYRISNIFRQDVNNLWRGSGKVTRERIRVVVLQVTSFT